MAVSQKSSEAINESAPAQYQTTLSLDGMTCASCVGNITRSLEKLPFVISASINLLSRSGEVRYNGKEHEAELIEAVEDAGYDAEVQSTRETRDTATATARNSVDVVDERHVDLKIEGMFCDHCPGLIHEVLEKKYGEKVVLRSSLSTENPILSIHYYPKPPSFTLRHIIHTIDQIDGRFNTSVFHPPSIEQRSRQSKLREQKRLGLRLLLSFVIAIPTFIIGIVFMSLVSSAHPTRVYFEEQILAGSVTRAQWALFFLATPVYFFAADVFHTRAVKETWNLWKPGNRATWSQRLFRFGSMNMLLSLGTSIAYWSSIGTLAQSASRSGVTMSLSYFDTVVFLTMFILAGRVLEAYSKTKTDTAVELLSNLRPKDAFLVSFGDEGPAEEDISDMEVLINRSPTKKVLVDVLEVGDYIRVPAGGSPSADGIVVSGSALFDESSLTGESRAVIKIPGDRIFTGTINKGDALCIRVSSLPTASLLDRIVSTVREGQAKRAPVERTADLITGYFVPAITLVAIITFVIWLGLGQGGALAADYKDAGSGSWTVWSLQFAIAVFVVACPCGIGLAAPTALFVGSGLAAQHGILVKGGGEAFQEASALDVIVFDKTGTLTTDEQSIVAHQLLRPEAIDARLTWSMVAALESSSNHPIAKALTSFSQAQGERVMLSDVQISEQSGNGLRGTFTALSNDEKATTKRYEAIIGKEEFMKSEAVHIDNATQAKLLSWQQAAQGIAIMAVRGLDAQMPDSPETSTEIPGSVFQVCAIFAFSNALRPEAARVIAAIRDSGVAVYMLTGDNATTANAVGAQLGIQESNIISGVLPHEKGDKIRHLQETCKPSHRGHQRAIVAMTGDGINDAPALAQSDVSIAVDSGSDVAIASAKFILVNSRLESILTLVTLSRAVFRRVKFNFGWALVYNLIGVPIAAGILYPTSQRIRLDPVWASLAMALSSVSVVVSSLLLRSRLPLVGFRGAKRMSRDGEQKTKLRSSEKEVV